MVATSEFPTLAKKVEKGDRAISLGSLGLEGKVLGRGRRQVRPRCAREVWKPVSDFVIHIG